VKRDSALGQIPVERKGDGGKRNAPDHTAAAFGNQGNREGTGGAQRLESDGWPVAPLQVSG
jgi:hypothetical protein